METFIKILLIFLLMMISFPSTKNENIKNKANVIQRLKRDHERKSNKEVFFGHEKIKREQYKGFSENKGKDKAFRGDNVNLSTKLYKIDRNMSYPKLQIALPKPMKTLTNSNKILVSDKLKGKVVRPETNNLESNHLLPITILKPEPIIAEQILNATVHDTKNITRSDDITKVTPLIKVLKMDAYLDAKTSPTSEKNLIFLSQKPNNLQTNQTINENLSKKHIEEKSKAYLQNKSSPKYYEEIENDDIEGTEEPVNNDVRFEDDRRETPSTAKTMSDFSKLRITSKKIQNDSKIVSDTAKSKLSSLKTDILERKSDKSNSEYMLISSPGHKQGTNKTKEKNMDNESKGNAKIDLKIFPASSAMTQSENDRTGKIISNDHKCEETVFKPKYSSTHPTITSEEENNRQQNLANKHLFQDCTNSKHFLQNEYKNYQNYNFRPEYTYDLVYGYVQRRYNYPFEIYDDIVKFKVASEPNSAKYNNELSSFNKITNHVMSDDAVLNNRQNVIVAFNDDKYKTNEMNENKPFNKDQIYIKNLTVTPRYGFIDSYGNYRCENMEFIYPYYYYPSYARHVIL